MNKERLHENYKKIYEGLNDAQKKAVDTIDGPVMVIAGPGTGKTQILSARIANILITDDVYPQNILCLTYTDAGVVAMRKRLLTMIGEDAYKVNICTYHTFCNQVIQENSHLFAKSALEPITDLETITLFRKLIDKFPADHLLKRFRGDVYFDAKNFKNLFSTIKRENFNIEDLLKTVDAYVQHIKEDTTNDTYFYKKKYKQNNPGDPKATLKEEIKKADKMKSALQEFDNYLKLMDAANRYDFDDMIRWVIKVFEENADTLLQYQEQFQYILVDEYQDTSGSQNHLIQLLIQYWGDRPNIFVVGDDDQSIYRFQGAEVKNMKAFRDSFANELVVIPLTQNYRSTQPILDTSMVLISQNTTRLINDMPDIDKNLVASNEQRIGQQPTPKVNIYNSPHEEYVGITTTIAKLLQDGVAANKIAILFTKHAVGAPFLDYFAVKNIPYYTKKEANVLEETIVVKLLNILRYLDSELDIPYSGDEILFEILHYDWFGIKPIEIAKTVTQSNKDKTANYSLRQFLQQQINADLFASGLSPELVTTSNTFESLIGNAANYTLQNLLQQVINECLLVKFIMQSEHKHYQLKVLTSFFNLIKQETHLNPNLGLHQFLEIIKTMQKEEISLTINDVVGANNGVHLLSFHGSKGLEYEHVFMMGCTESNWEKKRKKNTVYDLPKYMLSEEQIAVNKGLEEEELRRLFYVGTTRAEKMLYLSYSTYKDDGKENLPTSFLLPFINANLVGTNNLAEEQERKASWMQIIDEDVLIEFESQILMNNKKPIIGKLEEEIINRLVDQFVMNVTALSSYLNCPIGFYYNNLIRIPSAKNESMAFGTAIHDALNDFYLAMLNDANKAFPPIEELINRYSYHIKKQRESFTKEEYKRRLEQGPIVLTAYYDKYIDTMHKIVAVERNISTTIKGVPIRGKIDKIEFDGNNVNVVDYKTGSYKNAKEKLNAPKPKDLLGGDYWRQAVFYKILIDNYEAKPWQVVSTEFDFIEPYEDEYIKHKIVIKPEDVATVTEQIVAVATKIKAHDFYTGCGKADCNWCNFAKDNKVAIDYEDTETESQDILDEI